MSKYYSIPIELTGQRMQHNKLFSLGIKNEATHHELYNLTSGLYGSTNEDKRADLGGGRASATVPAVCAKPRRPWRPS